MSTRARNWQRSFFGATHSNADFAEDLLWDVACLLQRLVQGAAVLYGPAEEAKYGERLLKKRTRCDSKHHLKKKLTRPDTFSTACEAALGKECCTNTGGAATY